MKTVTILTLLACIFGGQSLIAEPAFKQIMTDEAPSGSYFSQGVRAGDFVYVAGMVGMDKNGVLVGDTFEAQMSQVLKNLEAILAAEGLTFEDVIKTQIFLKDVADFPQMNKFYVEAFTGAVKPVRTTVVTNLPKNALVEIECTAYAP